MTAVTSGTPTVVEEDIAFTRDGLTLRGILSRPDDTSISTGEAALTIHGWGGTRTGPHRIFVRLGRKLATKGISCLRFDLSGRGISDGTATTTCLDNMIADTQAAIALLKKRGYEKIHLIGLCSGGNVAIGTATLAPENVAELCCISTLPFAAQPASRGVDKMLGYLGLYARKALSPTTWKRLFRGEINVGGVGKVLGDSLQEDREDRKLKDSRRNIMAELKGYPGELHFIYGGGDPEAPAAREVYENFCRKNNIRADFTEVAGANHNFYSCQWADELLEMILREVGGEKAKGG